MRTTHVLFTLLSCSAVSTAWPWPPSFQNLKPLQPIEGFLERRQNGGNNQQSSSPPPRASASPPAPAPSLNTQSNSPSTTPVRTASNSGSNSGSQIQSQSPSQTASNTNPNSTSRNVPQQTSLLPINQQDPAGGINLLTPTLVAGSPTYYRIGGDPITFAWNYTSLKRAPTAIDILATLAPIPNQAPPPAYTLASNQSFAPTGSYIWDTNTYTQTSQLPVGTYTLVIYDADAEGGISATARPGYLGTYEQFAFGMYTGQPYSDLSNPYVCATCNAAGGKMERLTWMFLVGMVACSVGGFVWFAGAAGVFY